MSKMRELASGHAGPGGRGRRSRRPVTAAVAAVAAVAVAAVTAVAAPAVSSAAVSRTAGAAAAGPRVPVLHWRSCAGDFQCATARVPLDYRHPLGQTISIAVMRHRATGPGRRLGSLFVHPGHTGTMNFTSVYTINATGHTVQETYLPAIGDPWTTQQLPTPPTTK